MSRVDPQRPLLPSLLDRLTDAEPDVSSEPLWRNSYTVRQLIEDVRRDLEALLNTRHGRTDLVGQQSETVRSVLTYGVVDFTGTALEGPDNQERLRKSVEQSIALFEPRLQHVRVSVDGAVDRFERQIKLRIQAILKVEPIEERVAFDTIVETSKGNCQVKPSS